MNSKQKLQIGMIGVGLVMAGVSARAGLGLQDGTFDTYTTQGNDATGTGWYDSGSPFDTGAWYESAWYGPNVSPNGTPVMGLSYLGDTHSTPGPVYTYTSLGTVDPGAASLDLNFTLGSFTDGPAARTLGLTVGLYVDNSFSSAVGSDIALDSGATLVGEQTVSPTLAAGLTTPESMSFDLSGVNSGDQLYLRFINVLVSGASDQPWDAIDNISIATVPVPEPTTMALAGLGGALLMLRRRIKR